MKLYLESLGCAKNLIDSEVMLGRLVEAGREITDNPAEADIIVVNTCSFIESAVEESIDTILELAKYKNEGNCGCLIVAGCLPERYREDIVKSLEEVDIFLGTGAYDRIVSAVESYPDNADGLYIPDPAMIPLQSRNTPRIPSTPYMAYIKISEGCNRRCSYCIIPKLRGRQRSRLPGDIAEEARSMILTGKKELVLVAQDTTSYGCDLKPAAGFDKLLKDIAGISGKFRLRFLYGHPESIDSKVIETVGLFDKICSYFDVPVQHAATNVLKRMGRNYSEDKLYRLIDIIRQKVPDAALRTTVIVGFPGETDEDFQKLADFASRTRFDHLGVFTYSDSEDIPSHKLSGHVPVNVAEERLDYLMALQRDISFENNKKHLGETYSVLVEEGPEDGYYIGRTVFQAPEVDGVTFINAGSGHIQLGDFIDVMITDVSEYDLTGEKV